MDSIRGILVGSFGFNPNPKEPTKMLFLFFGEVLMKKGFDFFFYFFIVTFPIWKFVKIVLLFVFVESLFRDCYFHRYRLVSQEQKMISVVCIFEVYLIN